MTNGLFSLFSSLIANTPPYRKGLSSRKFLSLFLILFLAVGNVWADTQTYSFASSAELSNLTYTPGNASDTWDVCTAKTNSVEPRDGGFVQYKCAKKSTKATFVTKESFENITNISFFIASSDKGKTQVKIEVSPNADFSSDVTEIVNTSEEGLSGLGISSPSNSTWYSVSKSFASKSGYVRFTMTSSSSGKFWSFDDIVITYTPSSGGDPVCPETLTITSKDSKTAFLEGDAIELTAALSEGNGAITYQWYKGGTAEGNKLAGKTAAKLEIASCVEGDAGDYYCVASKSDCSDAVNADAFTITVAHNPCVTVTGAEQFIADYTINGAYAINNGGATNNGALKIDNGSDFVEIYAPAGKKISLIEMSLYAGADKKVGYGFGASAVVENDLMPWDWATKDVTGSYADYEFEPISSGKAKYFRLYRKVTVDAVDYGSGTSTFINRICVTLENTAAYTITYNLNGGTGTTPTESDKEAGTIVTLASGIDGITAPTNKKFNGWLVKDATDATVTVTDGKFTMPTSEVTITAQWALIADFDIKFFQGYGDPDAQIGETQTISTGEYATAPEDPTREGYRFVGWSTDGTEANIKTIEDYAIIEATTFTAVWKQVYTVTFDGSNEVKVDAGTKVASIASPTQAGKVFAGWYNGENKWDFSANVEGNMSLVSKWTEVDPNHFVYAYNDDFHYDGDVYKAPDGKVDNNDNQSNKAIATPYTLFEGTEGITSVIVKNGIYDSKGNHVNAFLKLNTNSESNLVFTIKEGYVATLKMKMGSWDVNAEQPNLTFKDASDNTYNFEGEMSGNASGNNYAELTYNLTVGTYTLTTATKTLYISNIDLTTTALAAHQVTYKANGGVGEDVVAPDATLIAECSFTYTGKKFIGWNTAADGTGTSYAVGAVVDATLELYAQWVDVYTVSFDLQGHGEEIAKQDIISGEKATEPTAPSAIGYDFGGWFTDAACTAGNEFNFNTAIDADKELYAKWTAFDGCVVLAPATTSGTTPASKANVELQTGSYGGKIIFAGAKDNNWAASFAYTENGLALQKGGADSIRVQLDYQMKVGTKLTFVVYTADDDKERGFYLKNSSNETKSTFAAKLIGETIYTYTVVEGDGLAGNSVFILGRNQTAYLKSIKVTNCGGKIVSVNYAISPAEAVDKATVTLSANKSVEGQTITATYSSIASGWDFDKWEVNGGATMDDAQANPVTITMGAENPTVTLVLKPGAIKHTVSFDAQGGSAVESQLVEENGNPILPAEPTKEDYIFKGWAEAADGDAVDVTSFAITAPKTFYAIWESDGAIKLLDKTTGAINTTDFITGVSANDNIDGEKGATWGGTQGSISGANALNKVVQYNAKTNKTKIQVSFYNKNSGDKVVYLHKIVEGETTAVVETLTVAKKSRYTSEYYEFNNEKNRSIYLTTNSTDVQILQVKVIESGEQTLRNAGQVGYSLNLKKGRVLAYSGTEIVFEGLKLKPSSSYSVINSEELQIKSNLSFSIESPVLLRVETNAAKYYVSQNAAEDGTTATAVTETGTKEFNLGTTGTWYIVPSTSSAVKLTNIAFTAPKCDAPVFNALANSDICSGESYVELDGTATITDGGTVTYKWYAEGGTEVLVETATYTPTADGSYYVVATNSLAGYTDNVVQSEVVTVTTHTGTAISEGLVNQRGVVDDVVTLTVTASGKDLHYTWKECATIGGTYTDVAGAADAASLDVTITEGLNKYYKVIVHGDCGEDQESIAKVEQFVPVVQQNVTGSTVWDWTEAASVNEIKLTDATTPKKNEGFVMANGAATVYNNANFESDKLYLEGEYIIRTEGGKLFQGQTIKFNTTVAGAVRVTFSHTGSDRPARELFINGVGTGTSVTGTSQTETGLIEVPAGEVAITAFHVNPTEGPGQQYVRVYKIEFLTPDYTRDNLNPTNIATICLPNGGIMTGATLYKMAGKNEYNKLCFDEVPDNIMVAGNPYLFVPENGNTEINVYYTDEDAAAAGNDNGLYGTYVRLSTVDDGQNSLLWGKYIISNNKYIYVDANNCNLAANRAYIVLNEVQPLQEQNPAPGLRRIVLGTNESQVATGVDQVQGNEVPTKMIINGQLFILRGEKMYDAQGKLVK